MKSLKLIIIIIFVALLSTSCGNSSNVKDSSEQQTQIVETEIKQKGTLTNFTKEDVARFAISAIMGRPSKSINVKIEKGLYYLSYVRKSDSEKFDYRVQIDGDRIIWASIDGRWRNSEYDEKINFEENGKSIIIKQTFSDNSIDIKEFKMGE